MISANESIKFIKRATNEVQNTEIDKINLGIIWPMEKRNLILNCKPMNHEIQDRRS